MQILFGSLMFSVILVNLIYTCKSIHRINELIEKQNKDIEELKNIELVQNNCIELNSEIIKVIAKEKK